MSHDATGESPGVKSFEIEPPVAPSSASSSVLDSASGGPSVDEPERRVGDRGKDKGAFRAKLFCAAHVTLLFTVVLATVIAFTHPRSIAPGNLPSPPDYSKAWAWAAHPNYADDADIVPAACGKDRQGVARADTFYVHPTSFFSTELDNAPLNDPATNILTDAGQLGQQASAFNGVSRIFAPRYRQASQTVQNSQNEWNNNNSTDLGTPLQAAMDVAFYDVLTAFEYFISEYASDPKRPIILASHSQGTMHLKRLLSTTTGWHSVADRIVAAYLIGNTIASSGEIPKDQLPPCLLKNSTGCFISWNTMLEGANGSHWLAKLSCWNEASAEESRKEGSNCSCACNNPLDWTWMSNNSAGRHNHYGAMNVLGPLFLRNFDEGMVSARCGPDGMLYVTPSQDYYESWGYFEDMTFDGNGELHAYDYTMFYRNIRVNVQERVNAWFAKSSTSGGADPPVYVEPKTCKPCGERSLCGWNWFLQIVTALLLGWVICSVLFGGCGVCALLACCRFKPASTRSNGLFWPSWCELIACCVCCCCCATSSIRIIRTGTRKCWESLTTGKYQHTVPR